MCSSSYEILVALNFLSGVLIECSVFFVFLVSRLGCYMGCVKMKTLIIFFALCLAVASPLHGLCILIHVYFYFWFWMNPITPSCISPQIYFWWFLDICLHCCLFHVFLKNVMKKKYCSVICMVELCFTWYPYRTQINTLVQPIVCDLEESGEWRGASFTWMYWNSRSSLVD